MFCPTLFRGHQATRVLMEYQGLLESRDLLETQADPAFLDHLVSPAHLDLRVSKVNLDLKDELVPSVNQVL